MIFSLIKNGVSGEAVVQLIYFLVVVFMTLTIHECAHGYIAYKMGDPTASALGRLTLNPVRHIDPIGLLMMLFIGFGWAKPVPINPRNFKNPKAGMAISAAAGPVSNVLMAILGLLIRTVLIRIFIAADIYNGFAVSAVSFFELFAMLNVWFAVFNLIPIPPLDGSRIVSYFLPQRLYYYYNYVERYGFVILIILLNLDRINKNFNFIWIFQTVAGWVLNGLNFAINWIFSLFGG